MELIKRQLAFSANPGSAAPSRRRLVGALAALGAVVGTAWPSDSDAAKTPRKKKRKPRRDATPRCTRNGERCETRGGGCQASHCLKAPFTIETSWASNAVYATYFHVPPENGAAGPSPYIYNECGQSNSACAREYPFACVIGSYQGPGNVTATVHTLLAGVYEYWLQLPHGAAAGEVIVVLRDGGGRIVRQWTNPANTTHSFAKGWRVFDIAGDGRIRSIDATLNGFYDPSTDVCPYTALHGRDRGRATPPAGRDRSMPPASSRTRSARREGAPSR